MKLGTIYAGVYGGMLFIFVIWIMMGWSEIRFNNATVEIAGVLVLAAFFAIPPSMAAYGAIGIGGEGHE